jgi:hypothetical protein
MRSATQLVLVAAAVALCVIGCASGSHRTAAPRTVTVVVTATTTTARPAPTQPLNPELVSFDGTYASIDYPRSFAVATNEESKGAYVDTTIVSRVNPLLMIRLDVLPTSGTTPDTNAARVRHALASQTGYRELQYAHTTFDGYDAIRWEFLVSEHGVLLHKVDMFFVDDNADEVAILTQAPASIYLRWSSAFSRIRASFSEGGSAVGTAAPPPAPTPPSSGASSFCDTHTCIDNFYNGNGYIVQCADGEWSHSGGLPGACSYHGGETGNVYTGTP